MTNNNYDPTDREIRVAINILKKLKKQEDWFMYHEFTSLMTTIKALESILRCS